MELKAVYEYEKPECPTMEENKNRVLLMMVRTGKISLGVAVMCLLCNCSWANEFVMMDTGGPARAEIELSGSLGNPIFNIIKTLFILGSLISLVLTLFLGFVYYRGYKYCEDIEEKERLRKRKNKVFITGTVICLVLIVLGFVADLCEVKYL